MKGVFEFFRSFGPVGERILAGLVLGGIVLVVAVVGNWLGR